MSLLKLQATCPKGLGSLLLPELEQLGASQLREGVAGVSFEGTLATAYRACLYSRLANRVLLVVADFAVANAEDLYQGVGNIPWADQLSPSNTLAIDFSGRGPDIRNTQFGAQRCKDAIVDQFRSRGLSRPNVDTKNPDLRINVRLYKGRVTVAIDLAGESLHRRGYRTDPGKAPLKENLAAAILIRSGWPEAAKAGLPLIDPMCGSGTLLIEAAMMAKQVAPGLGRKRWGFLGWAGHNPEQWRAIESDARTQVVEALPGLEIRGYDGDIRAIRRTEAIIQALELGDMVRVKPKALNLLTRPSHRAMPEGLLVCNPPWGERLGEEQSLTFLYRELGACLHREFQGWRAGILTSNPELGRAIGLRSHKQYGFNNGAVDIQLLLFEMTESNRLSHGLTPAVAKRTDDQEASANREPPLLSPGATMLCNRLEKNSRRLASWIATSGVTCYRLYDADMPEYAVAIDVYEGRVHVSEYAPPKSVSDAAAEKRFGEVLAAARHFFNLADSEEIAAKRRQRQRGKSQYEKMSSRGERLTVREGNARLLVNLFDYLDTGLFLDHRPLRQRLAEEARGKHFLNLFCYTGAATIQVALGGAATSTSVDLSNTYLRWLRDNLALNGLSDRQHRTERADCLTWLKSCQRQFDLIMLDPPSFSNSKATETSFDVERDQGELLAAAMSVLAPDGVMYFSTNRRSFRLADSIERDYRVENISKVTIPPDFQRNAQIHQCWRITHCAKP